MTMTEARGTEVVLGIGLGLLGLGLAFAFMRPKCPACSTRVENGARCCQGCGVVLAWPSR